MARAKTSISMYRGDSYPITLKLTDSTSGAVIDLTGASLLMTVDTLENPVDATTKLFNVTGVLATDPTTGVVQFTPTAANTAVVGTYYYDVQLTDADGNVRTVVKSTFTITQDITK